MTAETKLKKAEKKTIMHYAKVIKNIIIVILLVNCCIYENEQENHDCH